VWRHAFYIITLLALSLTARSQVLTYNFTDPCTKAVSTFNIPVTGTTTIYFLNKSASFTAADVSSGAFGAWINQTYADYRKVSPCSQQSGQVTQNQITSQIIGNTVQSVVSSIMASAQSQATSSVVSSATGSAVGGATDAGSKGNDSKQNSNGNNSSNNSSSYTGGNNGQSTGQGSTGSSGQGSSGNGGSGGSNSSGSSTSNQGSTEQGSQEVAASTTMSADASADKSGGDNNSSSSGGGSKGSKSNSKAGTNNPILVSSDFTTAQNLDKTFTPILNLSMNQSSLTGKMSWGMTGMVWFNFKQFALSGKYTRISVNKTGKLKYISNFALTAVYSYGNILGFIGYSGILNAGKFGVTGFNVSGAASVVSEDKNTFFSPSITAFYTKPFYANKRKRLTISPELYIISTPLIYSTRDRVTQSDRTFSFFAGTGFDYQLSKRFKFNLNYKLNASTNRDFPILSFFLVGSKVNL
jgi:hypothetical protein